MIAPTQPLMYVMTFKGGSCKKLRGTCSFFSDSSMLKKVKTGVSFNLSNTSRKQGVMNALQNQNMNSNILYQFVDT